MYIYIYFVFFLFVISERVLFVCEFVLLFIT